MMAIQSSIGSPQHYSKNFSVTPREWVQDQKNGAIQN